MQIIGLAFEVGNLPADLAQAAGFRVDGAQARHRIAHEAGAFDDGIAHCALAGRELADIEQHHALGGLLHLVDRVIHRGDQTRDVAAIERRDESAPHHDEHIAGDVVGIQFAVHDGLVVLRHPLSAIEQRAQRLGTRDHRLGMPDEHLEEFLFPGQQLLEPAEHAFLRRLRIEAAV